MLTDIEDSTLASWGPKPEPVNRTWAALSLRLRAAEKVGATNSEETN